MPHDAFILRNVAVYFEGLLGFDMIHKYHGNLLLRERLIELPQGRLQPVPYSRPSMPLFSETAATALTLSPSIDGVDNASLSPSEGVEFNSQQTQETDNEPVVSQQCSRNTNEVIKEIHDGLARVPREHEDRDWTAEVVHTNLVHDSLHGNVGMPPQIQDGLAHGPGEPEGREWTADLGHTKLEYEALHITPAGGISKPVLSEKLENVSSDSAHGIVNTEDDLVDIREGEATPDLLKPLDGIEVYKSQMGIEKEISQPEAVNNDGTPESRLTMGLPGHLHMEGGAFTSLEVTVQAPPETLVMVCGDLIHSPAIIVNSVDVRDDGTIPLLLANYGDRETHVADWAGLESYKIETDEGGIYSLDVDTEFEPWPESATGGTNTRVWPSGG